MKPVRNLYTPVQGTFAQTLPRWRLIWLALIVAATTGCGGGGSTGSGGLDYRDATAPYVIGAAGPHVNDTWVAPETLITATLRDVNDCCITVDSLDYASINPTTVLVEDTLGNPVTGTVSARLNDQYGYPGTVNTYSVIFTPNTKLNPSTQFTVTLTKGIKDRHGNQLASEYSWSFTTGPQGTGSWQTVEQQGSPASGNYLAFWTGSEMLVWCDHCGYGGLYNPNSDTWRAMSTLNAPSARYNSAAVWTGTELLVWGGHYYSYVTGYHYLNDGARYDPQTDTWSPITPTNAPAGRSYHMASWTGSEMIIWGGYNNDLFIPNYLASGGRYDPTTDTWTAMSATNAPALREQGTVVWTGTEMIVWGGKWRNSGKEYYLNSGGRYKPATDSWSALSGIDAPTPRFLHTAIWTGSEMFIWGGHSDMGLINGQQTYQDVNSGARYDPATNSWTATDQTSAPPGRYGHIAMWTGTHMLVWGGYQGGEFWKYPIYGSLYEPATDTWQATETAGAPFPVSGITGVWTGSQMIVWKATSTAKYGGIYTP